jgi:integrase
MACVSKRRGRWVVDFIDLNGKRRWITMPEGSTKKKATTKLREIEDQIARRVYLPERSIPKFSKVAEQWIKYKRTNLRESTYSVYKGHTKNHFSELDSLKVNRITTAKIEEFIACRQKEGMHILTLRKILVTLGQILAYAVRHRYIDYNPLRDAERPRGKGTKQEKQIKILTPNQITTLLDAVSDQKYKTLIRLAIMSGARQGELLGLKWPDVDWENNQIHIQRTFNKGCFYSTKTQTSNRRIDLGPAMMTELKRWRLACPKNRLQLVFPNESGKPMNYSNAVNRYFKPALKKAKLPMMRWHDLRHTFASLMIHQGENIKYIQSQLGHSSPTVTLNVYAHLMNPVNQESACRLENTIFSANSSKMVAGS